MQALQLPRVPSHRPRSAQSTPRSLPARPETTLPSLKTRPSLQAYPRCYCNSPLKCRLSARCTALAPLPTLLFALPNVLLSFDVAPISRQTRNCSLVRTSTRWSRRGAQGRSMIFFGGSPPHRPGGPWQRPHPIRSLRAGHRAQECVIPWARPPSPRCHQVATCPRLAGGAPLPAQALCCGRVPG